MKITLAALHRGTHGFGTLVSCLASADAPACLLKAVPGGAGFDDLAVEGEAVGIVDLTAGRRARLLDVVPGRSAGALSSWLQTQPTAWKAEIKTASLDPFRGSATGLAAALPDAVRVLDPFHVCRLALRAVDLPRRRTQVDLLGHRSQAGDPLYGVTDRIIWRSFVILFGVVFEHAFQFAARPMLADLGR